MIFDRITNADAYKGIHPRIAKGLTYLQNLKLDSFQEHREDIEGDALFALFQELETRSPEEGKWEAHLRYVDIQYVYSGTERMDAVHTSALGEPSVVAPERDVIFYPTPAQDPVDQVSLIVPAGSFAIFFQHDGHRPTLMAGESATRVQKIVLKVRLTD